MIIIFSIFFGTVFGLFLMKSFSYTPVISDGISEIRKIEIGGIEQTIMIRGENANNPIILYLHGGPGTTELVPFRLAHKELEKYFTIVSWEQRGTGKSYSSDIAVDSMNINQFVSDTRQLTEYILTEFKKDKLVLIGHSWGSALGILTVSRYPELFYAFVGSGQEVNPSEGERLSYEYLLNAAYGNEKAEDELRAISKPAAYPNIDSDGRWFEDVKTQRKWLIRLGGELYKRYDYSLLFNLKTFLAPEYSWTDYLHFAAGSVFSLKTMWPQVLSIDLEVQIEQVEVPVFFLQGRNDYNTPTILVQRYFEKLKAPRKELIIFESSGHMPMYEEPGKFETILVDKILPLCN